MANRRRRPFSRPCTPESAVDWTEFARARAEEAMAESRDPVSSRPCTPDPTGAWTLISGTKSEWNKMGFSRSDPALSASFKLRNYSKQRRRLEQHRPSTAPRVIPLEYIDFLGGNGRWRERKAKLEWERRALEEAEQQKERHLRNEMLRKRRLEQEARRRRQLAEEQQRAKDELERQKRELEERERKRREQEERARLKREEEAPRPAGSAAIIFVEVTAAPCCRRKR